MANLIPTETSIGPLVGTSYLWTYDVTLSSDQEIFTGLSAPPLNPPTNSVDSTNTTIAGFWTLYDFFGYVTGSCAGPSTGGWTCTAQNQGFTPSNVSPGDLPGVVNITWYYTGPTLTGNGALGGIDLGNFTAKSIYNIPVTESYASRGFQNNGLNIGSVAANVGSSVGPSAPGGVPEPTAIALFGSVLLLAGGALRRRWSR